MEPWDDDEEESQGMRGRVFIGLLLSVLAFGLAIGGAYSIGLSVGRGQAEEVAPALPLASESGQIGEGSEPAVIAPGPDQELPPEVIRDLREQGMSEEEIASILGDFSQSATGGAGNSGDAITHSGPNTIPVNGSVVSVDGGIVTVSTPEGEQKVRAIDMTVIELTEKGDVSDIRVGDVVTIMAVRGPEEDVLEAASITAVSAEE